VNRALKASLLAFGLIGLLLVVALAARSGHPTSDGRVSPRTVPASLQDSLVTLLVIAYVLAIIAIVVLFFHRRQWHEPRNSHWLRNSVTLMALMLLVTLFGHWAIRHGHLRQQDELAQLGQGQGQTQGPGQRSRIQPLATRPAEFQWPLALGVAGLVLLGGVLLLVRLRENTRPAEVSIQDELIRTIETTIEDLRRERDPRRAVIASYANMERALESHGFARDPAETPVEYLARILHRLDVRPDGVRSLTSLFEYAKFSSHEIDATMKEAAIVALLAVREDLRIEERAAA